jgi:hypothetical protein
METKKRIDVDFRSLLLHSLFKYSQLKSFDETTNKIESYIKINCLKKYVNFDLISNFIFPKLL